MNKIIFISLVFMLSANCAAEKVQIKPYDCGPLERGELGVVFSVRKLGSIQTYFMKGKAIDICPKLMSAKIISGYELNYCEKYKPFNSNECSAIKIFTITGYQNEPST